MKIKFLLLFLIAISLRSFSQNRIYVLSLKKNSHLTIGTGFVQLLRDKKYNEAIKYVSAESKYNQDTLEKVEKNILKNTPVDFYSGVPNGFVDFDSISSPFYEETYYNWASGKIKYFSQVKLFFSNDIKDPKIIKITVSSGKAIVKHDNGIIEREKKFKKEGDENRPTPPPRK